MEKWYMLGADHSKESLEWAFKQVELSRESALNPQSKAVAGCMF